MKNRRLAEPPHRPGRLDREVERNRAHRRWRIEHDVRHVGLHEQEVKQIVKI